MTNILAKLAACLGLFALLTSPGLAADRFSLDTPVPVSAHLSVIGRLPATNRLNLAIGLPLRNRDALTNLLQRLYDRGSTNFHQYLTPEQFTEQFGPSEQDYQKLKDYAKSNHLEVVGTYGNRAVLDVAGQVSDIENTFQIHLGTYQHPQEARQFYGPDVRPSVPADLPVLYVCGLDNYKSRKSPVPRLSPASLKPRANILNGSGSADGVSGLYLGYDFRNAYVPGVASTGAGQVIGLYEEDGYTSNDIVKYEKLAGLPAVPIQNYYCPGTPYQPGAQNAEVCLDIEMVIAMAPGASEVLVVEGTNQPDIMNVLASPPAGVPLALQVSSSFGDSAGTNIIQQLEEMAVQGQTFFRATGDHGSATNGLDIQPNDYNYLTEVGGTELSMTNNSTTWLGETVWDYQFIQGASHGEIATQNSIPEYQIGVNPSANGGSATYRNTPDVAMCADAIEIVDTDANTNNGQYTLTGSVDPVGGTSAAAPLWAGFIALVNQQAAAQGRPSVGFLNPAIYAIAQTPEYTNCFHDIISGNNTNAGGNGLFFAGPGYDNCTGLGSPNGQNLIDALINLTGPVIVDFNYSGTRQEGTINFPFSTLAKGTNAVSPGGTIFIINGGSSSETMTITKPMTITAQNGAATVGD